MLIHTLFWDFTFVGIFGNSLSKICCCGLFRARPYRLGSLTAAMLIYFQGNGGRLEEGLVFSHFCSGLGPRSLWCKGLQRKRIQVCFLILPTSSLRFILPPPTFHCFVLILRFWSLLSPYCQLSEIQSLPIKSSTCQGFGYKLFESGKLVSDDGWFDLSRQNLQMMFCRKYDGRRVDVCTDDAYHGGSCRLFSGSVSQQNLAVYYG